MQDPKISLSINGTPVSAAGWQSIYTLNLPPIRVEDGVKGDIPGLYYFELAVHPTCTQYTLVQSGVKPNDSARDGLLKISIMIPTGYSLKGGVTPYNVLIEVYNVFKQHNLDVIGASYRFKWPKADESIFFGVLNNFQLEPYNGPHRVMSGVDYALLVTPQSMMDQLFSDVHYPEFMPFKEIVVAEGGYATNMLSHITIPRKRVMTVRLNGNPVLDPRFAQIDSSRFAEQLTLDWCTLAGQSDVCFENYRWQFSVNDLLNGARYENVAVDFRNEVIDLRHVARPRQRRITVEVSGANPSSVLPGLSVNRQVPMNGAVVLQGEECLLRDMAVFVSPTTGYELVDKQIIGDVLMLTVRKHNRPIDSFSGGFDPYQASQSVALSLELRVEGKGVITESRDLLFNVTIKNNSSIKTVSRHVDFTPRGRNCYVSEQPVTLDSKMLSGGKLYVTCENQKYCTIEPEGQCISVSPNSNSVGVIVKKRSFYELHKSLVWTLTTLLILLGIGLTALFIWKPWHDPTEYYKNKMSYYDQVLQRDELTFAQVNEIHTWYNDSIPNEFRGELNVVERRKAVDQYKKIADQLDLNAANPDVETIRNQVNALIAFVNDGNNYSNINSNHIDYLKALYHSKDGRLYDAKGRKVNDIDYYWTYQLQQATIDSYDDIYRLGDEVLNRTQKKSNFTNAVNAVKPKQKPIIIREDPPRIKPSDPDPEDPGKGPRKPLPKAHNPKGPKQPITQSKGPKKTM